MLDELVDWMLFLLPWRVQLALLAVFVVLAGLLVLWVTWN